MLRERLKFGFTPDLSDPIRTGPFTPEVKTHADVCFERTLTMSLPALYETIC